MSMVPQNGHQQLRPNPQASFMPSNPALDSSFLLDSPQVAKQMAALNAASQARIAQNTRIPPSSLGGTSSGPYHGAINSHSSYSAATHDLLANPANAMSNTYPLSQSSSSIANNSFLDAAMSQQNTPRTQPSGSSSLKQRQQGFLNGLAGLMAKRGSPLPPSLTGIPTPNYDPSHSPWSIIEPSSEVGSFKLAGKDVDLFKLWGLVFQHGGGQAISNSSGWGTILSHFDLPDDFPEVQTNGSTSVALMLSQYYMAILFPFEEMYKKNLHDQQKKAQMVSRQAGLPGQPFPPSGPGFSRPPTSLSNPQQAAGRPISANGAMNPGGGAPLVSANGLGQFPALHNQTVSGHRPLPTHTLSGDPRNSITPSDLDPLAHVMNPNTVDQDVQGIKRKHDQDDRDIKRARQKTDPPDGNPMLLPVSENNHPSQSQVRSTPQIAGALATTQPRQSQPSRRKIEYVPLMREVESYGGRDFRAIDAEWNNLTQRRPLRDISEWGMIDIETLTMSLRSRLSIELSYALTTFTILSTMRGQAPGSGFPINQCGDLLDEVLDLLEEVAFGEPEQTPERGTVHEHAKIVTNRELVGLVYDVQCLPFAPLQEHQGSKDPSLGPSQRPGDIILTVTNIIRNLSVIPDNLDFISTHARLVDILLRVCDTEGVNGSPSPASKKISVADLILIRKDALYTLSSIAGLINLSASSSLKTLRMTRRAFELVASYLVDPQDALSPLASVQLAGTPPNANLKPPTLVDTALEVFTRFSQLDANRQIITKSIPQHSLWLLLTSLVRRLPIIDADFALMQREYWLSYVEKTVLAIYSVVFIAPPDLKHKIKTDRRLGFKTVMLRMAHKALVTSAPDVRPPVVFARRAIEAIKLLDKPEDSFDTTETTAPTLSFGMGFSDAGDTGGEKGTGILGGNQEMAWDMLLLRDVGHDEVMFNELESLVRVECQ